MPLTVMARSTDRRDTPHGLKPDGFFGQHRQRGA